MSGATRAWRPALVWGLVGGLSFLVLLQGYELVTGQRVDLVVKVGVALAVTAGATVLSRLTAVHGPLGPP